MEESQKRDLQTLPLDIFSQLRNSKEIRLNGNELPLLPGETDQMNVPLENIDDFHFIIIPGQNGMGGTYFQKHNLSSVFSNDITRIATPGGLKIDLGQEQCMKFLHDAMQGQEKNVIIHATSQGTATALNYVAEYPEKVKALILEATMGSGNSAILHTIREMGVGVPSSCADSPGSDCSPPYSAKVLFPSYSPSGKQAIKSIKKLPQDLPIIIIHSKNDPQLSYDDACALYYGLRLGGNTNTYFFSQEGGRHIDILSWDDEKNDALNKIFERHGLPYNKLRADRVDEADIAQYQPDPEQFKKHYEDLERKEKKHEQLYSSMKYGALLAAALAVAYKLNFFSSF